MPEYNVLSICKAFHSRICAIMKHRKHRFNQSEIRQINNSMDIISIDMLYRFQAVSRHNGYRSTWSFWFWRFGWAYATPLLRSLRQTNSGIIV